MKLVFVHGWSVTSTGTYGGLPEALEYLSSQYNLDIDINHIHLGRYISFQDEVTMDDVVRAYDRALCDVFETTSNDLPLHSCITHSTGGPVVREWVNSQDNSASLPLKHLVMLAPANHGSALAKLGKARIGRIKSWFEGVEPGQRILDWLALGSDEQWQLNITHLNNDFAANGFYPFVLTGQTIDRKFYDFLNNYLTEAGSDGVVRVTGANMNYGYIKLSQNDEKLDVTTNKNDDPDFYRLIAVSGISKSIAVPLGVIPDASHSGDEYGIMKSAHAGNTDEKKVVGELLKCLQVDSVSDYETRRSELTTLTYDTQQVAKLSRYVMFVFQISDDRGERILDYDLFILGGSKYKPDDIPEGFFVDRQKNDATGRLVYYVDADILTKMPKIGIRIVARPDQGFSYYAAAEFRSEDIPITEIATANQALYVDVILKRMVDKNVFRLGPATEEPHDFKEEKTSKDIID